MYDTYIHTYIHTYKQTNKHTNLPRALAVDAGLYNVWFNLANAYLKLDKKQEAVDALRRTLHLNPNVTAAR